MPPAYTVQSKDIYLSPDKQATVSDSKTPHRAMPTANFRYPLAAVLSSMPTTFREGISKIRSQSEIPCSKFQYRSPELKRKGTGIVTVTRGSLVWLGMNLVTIITKHF